MIGLEHDQRSNGSLEEHGPCVAEFVTSHWIDLGCGIRVQLRLFADGWGWHAWQSFANAEHPAFTMPATDQVARRFRTQALAVQYFALLAKCMHSGACSTRRR